MFAARVPLDRGEIDDFAKSLSDSSDFHPNPGSTDSAAPRAHERHGERFLLWFAASVAGVAFTLLSAYLIKRFGWN